MTFLNASGGVSTFVCVHGLSISEQFQSLIFKHCSKRTRRKMAGNDSIECGEIFLGVFGAFK